MVLAFVAFVTVRRWQPGSIGTSLPLSMEQRFALSMAAFIGGMLSAKLPFLLESASGMSGPGWIADGKTVTTGLAGAYVMVELAKRTLGIDVKTGDTYALPLAVALAIGRWGCFFNGCCYGMPTQLPWGVDFLGDGLRHPTQIYEVLFHTAMACILWYLASNHLLRLQRLKFYLIAYCIYRFLTEFIRPEPAIAIGLTFYQWFTIVFALGLAIQWYRDSERYGLKSNCKNAGR
jgi:prolipoprotein diacylglyceryltransferase